MPQLLIGADPEFFVKRKRHIISAHPYPFGTKAQPMATKNGSIQIDGIALECNVLPSASKEEFVKNVHGVMEDLRTEMRLYEPEAEVVSQPSIFFGLRRLSTLPLEASELGCRTDWNAWTNKRNKQPDPRSPIRTASGHIHLGWTKDKLPNDGDHFRECVRVVRQLDFYLGLPSLLWDKDNRRRQLYGTAGSFRPTSYGCEYRVLSNAWTRSESVTGWVYEAAVRAMTQLSEGVALEKQFGNLPCGYIDNGNTKWTNDHPQLVKELLQ